MKNFIQEKIAHLAQQPYYFLLLAVSSGLLAGFAWYRFTVWFIFFAFVPLLLIERQISENSSQYKRPTLRLWLYAYLAMLIWNITATWWIWNSTVGGSIAAFVANSALMTLPILFFHWIKKYSQNKFGYFAFIACWLTFEYVHLHWSLSWTWLLVGNAFAHVPTWVQWYEYTGFFGGSFWVLWVNITLLHLLRQEKRLLQVFLHPSLLALFFVPLIFSHILYFAYEEKGKEVEIVVVQPNLDCFEEKFTYNARTGGNSTTYIPYSEQVNRYFQLSEPQITDKTALVAFPETSLHEAFIEKDAAMVEAVQRMQTLQNKYPNLSFLSGADTYTLYDKPDATPTTRVSNGVYYDYFNTGLFVGNTAKIEVYHKSKLVVGVETNPLRDIFKLFGKTFMINLGGISGDLGTQKERMVFFNKDSIGFAPVICYESIYGDFVTEYIRKGANIICIITNDGWWGDTAGHVQHLAYASLRAIETRRSIARAANTGISGFINQRGDGIALSKYDEMLAMRHIIKANTEMTFYTQTGDYIGRIMVFLACLMLIAALVKNRLMKK
jgi:apolipoprotein N-acyltransferase